MPMDLPSGADLHLWRAQTLKARQLSCEKVASFAFATMNKVAEMRAPQDKRFLIASHQQFVSEERKRSPVP